MSAPQHSVLLCRYFNQTSQWDSPGSTLIAPLQTQQGIIWYGWLQQGQIEKFERQANLVWILSLQQIMVVKVGSLGNCAAKLFQQMEQNLFLQT